MSQGFVLNISKQMLDRLDVADTKIKQLATTSEQAQQRIVAAFQQMQTQGIDAFINSLDRANQVLGSLNVQSNGGLSSVAEQATKGARAITDMQKVYEQVFKADSNKVSNSAIVALEKQIDKAKEKLTTLSQVMARGVVNTPGVQQEYALQTAKLYQLQRQLELERQSAQEKLFAAQQQDAYDQKKATAAREANERAKQATAEHLRRLQEEDRLERQKFSNLERLSQKQAEAEDKAIAKAEQAAKRKARADEQAAERKRKADEQAAKAAERAEKNRIKTPNELIAMQGSMKTLQQLNNYANELKKTLSTLQPNTKEFERLNNIYAQTRHRVNEIKTAIYGTREAQKALLNTAEQLKRAFAMMFSISAIKGYVNQIAQVRGEFELQKKSLESLLQDKDKANEIWDKTVALAIKSPFQVRQLVTYTKQLAAYQVESEKLYDTTKRLADISAGLGVDMQRLILAYGQVKAANYLRATELRQFTEAGINMLGELAKYYSEIEQATVTVAQVQERITKRQVSFDDVNEIIQRMTDEGGLFFNMQEKQANTLKGQISNLRDAIDLMLNDIGKVNEGVLKGTVALTRELIDNWRAVATAIKLAIGGATLVWLANFARGIRLTGAALTFAAANGKAAIGVAARLKIAIQSLNRTISSNPWTALAAVVVAAGVALWDYNKAVDAANEKYDEASAAIVRQINTLDEQRRIIEENNRTIENSESSEEDIAEARSKNKEILEELKKKYPEYYKGISQATNGTIRLTDETERLNRQLRIRSALQQAAKGGWFQDDLAENYKQAVEGVNEYHIALAKAQSEATKLKAELMNSADWGTPFASQLYEALTKVESAKGYKDVYEYLMTIDEIGANDKFRIGAPKIEYDWSQKYLNDFAGNLDNMMVLFRSGITNAQEESNEAAAKWLDTTLEGLGIVDTEVKKFAWEHITKEVGIELVMVGQDGDKKYTEADLTEEWQKKIWGFIKNIKASNPNLQIPVSLKDLATQDLVTIIKRLRTAFPGLMTQSKEDVSASEKTTQLTGNQAAEEAAKDAQKSLDDLIKYVGSGPSKSSGRGTDKVAKALKDRLSLIKEMNSEYEKLSKVMYAQTARQKVLNSFIATAKKLSFDISNFTFDDEGTLASLKTLLGSTKRKDLKAEIQKVIDNFEIAIEINANKEQLKKYGKEVDEYFDAYDISKSLDDLGVHDSFAKKYFNVEHLDIDTLRTKIEGMKTSYEKLGEDGVKEYEKMIKKVDGLEDKVQKERLKKYLKFATNAIGDRAKIKFEELNELAEIEKTFGSNESGGKAAAQIAVKNDAYQKMKKLEWEEFQKTDTFINLFKDLDMASEKLLKHTISKLNDFKDQWTDIPIEDMRNIIEKVGELEMKLAESSPMTTIKTLREEGFRTGKKGREANANLQEQSIKKEQELAANEEQLAIYETILRLKQAEKDAEAEAYATSVKMTEAGKLDVANLQKEVNARKVISDKKKTDLASIAQQQVKQKQLLAAYQKQSEALGNAQKMANDLIGAFSELAEVLGADSDGIGMTFVNMGKSMMDSVLNTIMLQIQLNAAAVAAQGLGAAMNAAMGIVGWIVMAVQLLTQALTAIFKAKDKALEKQIEELANRVEKTQEEFDKLVESIDELYSTDAIAKASKDIAELNKQILNNLKAQKALQQERKQTDEVKDEIDELTKSIAEAEEALIDAQKDVFSHATDGILDSAMDAARGFVDAWADAYAETGNGMKGLEENFEEMLMNMAKQQAAQQIVGHFAKQWQQDLEKYISGDDMELTKEDAQAWAEEVRRTFPELNAALEGYLGAIMDNVGSGSLSGLEEGIAGASEETVQVVAAYLNSIRFFVAENNAVLKQLRDYQLGETDAANPMLAQLRIIAQQTGAIRTLLDSVTQAGHPNGLSGIRVFMD